MQEQDFDLMVARRRRSAYQQQFYSLAEGVYINEQHTSFLAQPLAEAGMLWLPDNLQPAAEAAGILYQSAGLAASLKLEIITQLDFVAAIQLLAREREELAADEERIFYDFCQTDNYVWYDYKECDDEGETTYQINFVKMLNMPVRGGFSCPYNMMTDWRRAFQLILEG